MEQQYVVLYLVMLQRLQVVRQQPIIYLRIQKVFFGLVKVLKMMKQKNMKL